MIHSWLIRGGPRHGQGRHKGGRWLITVALLFALMAGWTQHHSAAAAPAANTVFPLFDAPQESPFGLSDVGDNAAPVLGDLDNDGDLDVLVGETGGNLLYFENSGTAAEPAFAAVTNPFGLTSGQALVKPTFGDLDNDGDPDLLEGSNSADFYYFENLSPPDPTAVTLGGAQAHQAGGISPLAQAMLVLVAGVALLRLTRRR